MWAVCFDENMRMERRIRRIEMNRNGKNEKSNEMCVFYSVYR